MAFIRLPKSRLSGGIVFGGCNPPKTVVMWLREKEHRIRLRVVKVKADAPPPTT
jgi:hypothetical protein